MVVGMIMRMALVGAVMVGVAVVGGGVVEVAVRVVLFFGDFGVSDAATVAWRYTRRGGPRLSVQGEPLVVLTRGP